MRCVPVDVIVRTLNKWMDDGRFDVRWGGKCLGGTLWSSAWSTKYFTQKN
jgi:hypothetical protein